MSSSIPTTTKHLRDPHSLTYKLQHSHHLTSKSRHLCSYQMVFIIIQKMACHSFTHFFLAHSHSHRPWGAVCYESAQGECVRLGPYKVSAAACRGLDCGLLGMPAADSFIARSFIVPLLFAFRACCACDRGEGDGNMKATLHDTPHPPPSATLNPPTPAT